MAQCQEPRAQMVKLFLIFPYFWQEDVQKIAKVPGARAITSSGGVITYCCFSIETIHLHLASFYATNTFENKSAIRNAH